MCPVEVCEPWVLATRGSLRPWEGVCLGCLRVLLKQKRVHPYILQRRPGRPCPHCSRSQSAPASHSHSQRGRRRSSCRSGGGADSGSAGYNSSGCRHTCNVRLVQNPQLGDGLWHVVWTHKVATFSSPGLAAMVIRERPVRQSKLARCTQRGMPARHGLATRCRTSKNALLNLHGGREVRKRAKRGKARELGRKDGQVTSPPRTWMRQ